MGLPGMISVRTRQLALLLAYLPSLLFIGHWPLAVDIPGTDLYIGLPLTPAARSHAGPTTPEGEGHDHAQHCHADLGACSDVPFTGASPFALLSEAVAFLGAAGLLLFVACGPWRPHHVMTVLPGRRPPRPLAFALS